MNAQWRLEHLMRAPHRLAYFLAMLVLLLSSIWWTWVQSSRLGLTLTADYSVSPWFLHAAVMTFGFMPLFFAGFLFTAGPKWLAVQPVSAREIVLPLTLQALGWLMWIVGGHSSVEVALLGLALAVVGLALMQLKFWDMLRKSVVQDRLHATMIGLAGLVGIVSLLAFALFLFLNQQDVARQWILTGLWGFIVTTYATVTHRMLAFFTASALPMVRVGKPVWILYALLAAAAFEIAWIWLDWLGLSQAPNVQIVMMTRGLAEVTIGSVLVWLSLTWGLLQSLKVRLLAMLHIGFVWFGLSFLLAGASQLLGFRTGTPFLGLGALHALTMGFLGSVMMAMVTRVSSGHSGRPLVVDNLTWLLFLWLQICVVLRIASVFTNLSGWLLGIAALGWTLVMAVWGARMMIWYGQPRMDGQTG